MKKRILSIVLAICLVLTLVPTTVFAESTQKVYVVAGRTELCGIEWNGFPTSSPDNVMSDNGDGTYTKVYTNVAVMDGYQFKVVENTLDGMQTWHGLDNGNNVTFNVKSVCDVTITFDSATLKITLAGEGVELPSGLNVESICAVGNGDPEDLNWLNGIAWDPAADGNLMTEVSSGVYEITYTDIEAYYNYQFKFAVNGSWNDSWGGAYAGSGVESDAVYNGENIIFSVPYELADVTIRLDLTNFEFATKTGAKFTVTITNKTKSGFTYTVSDDNKVTITGYTGSATDVVIPDTIDGKPVKAIDAYAFKDKAITSVTIPNSVTSIGIRAFQNCKALTSIMIPSGVTIIEECTFEHCDNLSSVTIPDGVTAIGNSSFHLCKNLESINIPDSVTFIGDSAFQQCQKLTSINIPNGVSSIRYGVFGNCTSLKGIKIPNGVTSINEYAFYGCTSLESVEIPNSVTFISDNAFGNCTSLESIFLPNGLDVTIPSTASQVRYNLDETTGEVTITKITLGTDKTSVAIPATICGYPVVAVADSEQSKVGSHTCKGGTATCTAKAECSICGKDYGEKDSDKHTGTKAWEQNETQHKQYWSCCNAVVVDYEDHTWNNGVCSECDYICTHKDTEKNHACDYCDANVGVHEDINTDHKCDYGCNEAIGVHADTNSDHKCDYGCNEAISTHEDTNSDHKCDYGCDVAIGVHEDTNTDHKCDYGCDVVIGIHADTDSDHNCDYCGEEMTTCLDDDKDHLCDICGATLSQHSGGTATCTSKAICEYCHQEYGELNSSNHNFEKIPAKAASVTETGNEEYWHCLDCGKYFADENGANEIKLDDTVISKLPPEIIEGEGQSITQGEVKELTFRSNAAFGDFIRVELDGVTVDAENYTATEGSTIITLKADYVATLSAGEHTIAIVSESGTATTTFTVNAKAVDDTPQTDDTTKPSQAENNNTKSPETGNDEYALYFAMLFTLCGAGIIITSVYIKRKKYSAR